MLTESFCSEDFAHCMLNARCFTELIVYFNTGVNQLLEFSLHLYSRTVSWFSAKYSKKKKQTHLQEALSTGRTSWQIIKNTHMLPLISSLLHLFHKTNRFWPLENDPGSPFRFNNLMHSLCVIENIFLLEPKHWEAAVHPSWADALWSLSCPEHYTFWNLNFLHHF